MASVATGVTVASTLGGVLGGTSFQKAIFPFARVVNSLRSYATLGRTIAALDGGVVAADAVGSIMGGVILFVTGTTEESIAIDSALNLPKKLASLIEAAPTTDIDPAQLLNSTSGTGELYALFVNASAPSPSIVELGSNSANAETAFLNPPGAPLPDPQTDPEFVVTVNGAVNPQASISWYDVASQTTNTARLHESWFVVRSTDNQGNPAMVPSIIDQPGQSFEDIQSLHITYTDWAGVEHVAGLLKPSSGGYKFISINQSGDTPLVPSTCLTDGTCGYADDIQYVDAAGNQYSARVADPVQAVPPTVETPGYSPSAPAEGQPVTFSVNASSAIGGSLTYQWSFQCSIGGPTGGPPPPCFFAPPATATGNPVTYTFPVNRIYGVSVTVTDSAGEHTSAGVQVDVAHVPPTLLVYPACDPFLICPVSNVFEVPLGTATTLGGYVVHAGSADTEVMSIDWGDGTSGANTITTFPANSSTQADGIHLPFQGTHQYAAAGDYTVNVKVTDQSGGTAAQTVTEHVVMPTTTSTTPSTTPPRPPPSQVAGPRGRSIPLRAASGRSATA